MKKKEFKLSENAIKILDNIKIENKNSYEVIIIELNLIFQIEKSQKIKKCTYSSILIDNDYKSNRFILVFKKEEEIPKKGDIINVSQIKKYINEIDKEYIYECNEITFLAKEKDFIVDISKIQNYYKNENQIIEKQNTDIINNKIDGFEIQKNEDDDGEEEEEEEEDDDNDEDINKDKKEKFNNNIIKNKINNFEEEKISEKNIINNKKINLINKENDNKKDICINNIFGNCQKYLLISELDFNIQNFNIYLKCITKFEIKEFRYNKNKKYQNYIFTDIKHDMIEGVSFDFECDKFDKILNINDLYQVNNSFLKSNNKIYSKTDCPFKLFFTRHTAIFNVSNLEEIKNKFFENYNAIINKNENENINKNDFLKIGEITYKNKHDIVNVFGFVLKDFGTFISSDQFNREFIGRRLLLGDDSNYKIIIVFWHPSDLKKVYEEGELLYIQKVKVGEYNGFKTLYGTKCRKIQNSFNFEYDNKLKKYFLEHKNINDYFNSKEFHNLNSKYNDVNNNTRDKLIFIKDLLSINNSKGIINNNINNIFKISAKVKNIRHSEKNYYYGCKYCRKKMINKICSNCGCKDKIIILHYSIRVVDSTGTLWLLFFGDIAKNFLGMSGEEYKNILDKGISYNNKEMFLLNKKFEDKDFIFIGKNQYYNYPNFQGYRFLVKFFCKKEKKEYYSLVNYLKNFLK